MYNRSVALRFTPLDDNRNAESSPRVPANLDHSPRPSTPGVLLVAAIDAVGIARLPRLFKDAGFHVSVLASSGIAALSSRHISERIVCPKGLALLAEELDRRLNSGHFRYDAVVLCDEIILRYLTDLPDPEPFAAAFPVALADRQVVLSNVQFMSRANTFGLPLPAFEICTGADEGRQAAARLGYPLMFKAEYGMAGSGVRLLESEADWEKVDLNLDSSYLLQRFLTGETGATNILFDHGTPVCWFSFYKRYNWPNRFGPSGGGVFMCSDQVGEILKNLGQAIPFHGLCSIDWVQDPGSGRLAIIEFNPRPTPSLHADVAAGVSFAKGLGCLVGRNTPSQQPLATALKSEFMMFPESAFHAIDRREAGTFLRSLRSAPLGDPGLLAANLRRIVTHYLGKLPFVSRSLKAST